MATYTVRMSDEQCSETETFEADSLDAAAAEAGERTRDWIEGGDWGDDGAIVSARWELYEGDNADGDPVEDGHEQVEIEPDHDTLMRRAGAPADCDHEFISTYEVEGGLRENPGVWSHGGTTMSFRSHCRHCGLQKREVSYGSQRNPGQSDRVEYEMPATAECD